ncbi:MAG: DUF6544 family protein [Bacteroidota bacterium]
MVRSFFTILVFLAGVFLLAVGVMCFNAFLFNKKTKKEIRSMKSEIQSLPQMSEPNNDLPAPVSRYLQFSGVFDQKPVQYAFTKRKGRFRMNPRKAWMSLRANTYHITNKPGFIRDATMDAGFVSFCVREKYMDGKANVLGKLFGAFTVMNENNKVVDRSSLLRYLADLPWLPSAFLSPNINWEPIDEIASRATISEGDLSVSAVFFFEPSGAISHLYAKDLYRDNTTEDWSAVFRNYVETDGYLTPANAEYTWNLDSGDFTYEEFEVFGVEFEQ